MTGLIESARREVAGQEQTYSALAAAIASLIVVFPFTLLGGAAADVTTSAIAVTFLVYCYLTRDFTWTKEPWLLLALAIWAYLAVRGLLSIQPEKSGGSAVLWVRFVIMAAALHVFLRRSKALQELLLWSILIMAIFGAADALLQYVRGYDLFGQPPQDSRLTGPLNNPAIGFVLLFGGLPAIVYLYDRAAAGASILPRICAAAAGLLIFLAIFLSGERMPFIQACFAFAVLLLLRPSLRVLVPIIAMGAIAITTVLVVFPDAGARQASVLTELSKATSSSYGQAMMAGVNVAQDNPVFGVGMKNFKPACPAYVEADYTDGCRFIHPHHLWIQLGAETGVIGLIGFAILFALALAPAVPHLRDYGTRSLLVGSAVAMIILVLPVMTFGNFFSSWRSALVWFLLGTAAALGRERSQLINN